MKVYHFALAGPRSAVGSASDSRARGPGFDARSGHILLSLLLLIQEGQLSVTGKSMCLKYWLTAQEVKPAQEVWLGGLTDHHHPDMTIAVYRGCKTTQQPICLKIFIRKEQTETNFVYILSLPTSLTALHEVVSIRKEYLSDFQIRRGNWDYSKIFFCLFMNENTLDPILKRLRDGSSEGSQHLFVSKTKENCP